MIEDHQRVEAELNHKTLPVQTRISRTDSL